MMFCFSIKIMLMLELLSYQQYDSVVALYSLPALFNRLDVVRLCHKPKKKFENPRFLRKSKSRLNLNLDFQQDNFMFSALFSRYSFTRLK